MDSTIQEIKKLPEIVINRIAAGEVVQRPANVVKELIENSLDAGATQITVTVKNGGLKLLQIEDNGHGIRYEDLEILCHRFTTSKLRQFEDLQGISTFGFRGEALASVSHVAYLSVVTKTADSQLAYRADYIDGILKDKPKPCAGNQGTIIMVEDLFYNMTIRRKALKSSSEEHAKIVDVVTKYALHNPKVGFLLKRQPESVVDVRTTQGSTVEQIISSLYGLSLAKDIITFNSEDASLGFSGEGFLSHPSYSGKKFIFVLFINDRLVDCNNLKKGLELLFSQTLPKNNHPFLYLKLKILPENLDVNVHPTKLEVHFLNEDSIVEQIQNVIERKILNCNESRIFYIKNLQPNAEVSKICTNTNEKSTVSKIVYDHQLVRTDSKERKLEEFFTQSIVEEEKILNINFGEDDERLLGSAISENTTAVDISKNLLPCSSTQVNVNEEEAEILSLYADETNNLHWRNIQLSSVFAIQSEIRQACSPYLRTVIRNHTFVGSVDAKLALVQHQTGLYLVDTERLSEELFYQMFVFRFGNFGVFRLKEPCSLYELALLGLESKKSFWNSSVDKGKSQLAREIVQLLTSKSEMLWDYFSIEIKDGMLLSLPNVLDDYIPQFEGLPLYIVRLSSDVDWTSEKICFESLCRETAKFYALKHEYCEGDEATAASGPSCKWKWIVETLLYPTFKSKLMPTAECTRNGCLTKLTDLHDLYKVFERC